MEEWKQLTREQRGKLLAVQQAVKPTEKGWSVKSQTNPQKTYFVNSNLACNCADHETHGVICKHAFAVQYYIKQTVKTATGTIVKETRITYTQNWPAYDKAQTSEKGEFMRLLHELCKTVPEPEYSFGRKPLPLQELLFASILKVYSTFSLRRFMSDGKMAVEKEYLSALPCYASVGYFLQREDITPVLIEMVKTSAIPLASVETKFAVDSTGFSTNQYARWFDHKWGKDKKEKVWLKAHACCGVVSNIITSVKITDHRKNDSPELEGLVKTTSENFQIDEVSADLGYSSRHNLEAIETLGGVPYIPFKSNSKGRALGSPIWKKMWHVFQLKQDEFLAHYHKRSNVETTFSMVKAKFGARIRNKSQAGMMNELLCKVLCHNLCVNIQEMNELGIKPDFACVESPMAV